METLRILKHIVWAVVVTGLSSLLFCMKGNFSDNMIILVAGTVLVLVLLIISFIMLLMQKRLDANRKNELDEELRRKKEWLEFETEMQKKQNDLNAAVQNADLDRKIKEENSKYEIEQKKANSCLARAIKKAEEEKRLNKEIDFKEKE